MCNALEELVNEGVQKGRLESIQAIVRTCKRLNLDEKHTVDNIMQEFPVSEEETAAYRSFNHADNEGIYRPLLCGLSDMA